MYIGLSNWKARQKLLVLLVDGASGTVLGNKILRAFLRRSQMNPRTLYARKTHWFAINGINRNWYKQCGHLLCVHATRGMFLRSIALDNVLFCGNNGEKWIIVCALLQLSAVVRNRGMIELKSYFEGMYELAVLRVWLFGDNKHAILNRRNSQATGLEPPVRGVEKFESFATSLRSQVARSGAHAPARRALVSHLANDRLAQLIVVAPTENAVCASASSKI